MRIVAGSLKGRRLATGSWPGLRPTSEKLREALFNVLGTRIVEARVLDGFAGSGALGIEALSRGAVHVTFMERDPRAIRVIRSNLAHCDVVGRYAIIRADLQRGLRRLAPQSCDVILLDPPYDQDDILPILERTASIVAPEGIVVLEHARRRIISDRIGQLARVRVVRSGDSNLSLFELTPTSVG